jgi:hypothetical protein
MDVTTDRDNLTTMFDEARNARRISRLAQSSAAGLPNCCNFCLRSLDSAAKRVLFSSHAASAKAREMPNNKISDADFCK